MNIQCQQCGTSYAVADDKVRGRLMKVRCKSCGEAIRVDGTPLAAASNPPVASRPGVDGAIWHIAVGDGTQGPYTLDELREYYAQGSVLLDTLVYREGYEEWLPAGEVPELRALTVPSHSQTGAQAFAGAVSMGSDPFGERRAAQSSPRVSAAQVMEGQSEHTVQFSLDQIRALSSVSGPSVSPSTSMMPPRMSTSAGGYGAGTSSAYTSSAGSYAAGTGYAPSSTASAGYASGDGSGLIDVRKLAELHAAMNSERQDEPSEPLLPASGSYAHTLAPLSLPLPPPSAAQGIDSRTKIVAGLAALGMVLTAAVGVLALTRPSAEPVAASQPEGTSQTALAAEPPSGAAPAVAEEEEEKAGAPAEEEKTAKADEPAAAEDEDEPSNDKARASSRSGKRGGKREARGSSKEREEAEEPVAKKETKSAAKDDIDDLLGGEAKPKKTSSASSSIDDLLDNAVSGKKAAPKAEEKAPSSDLPKTPGRDQMLAALSKAKAKAGKCKGSGVATAQIQIAGKTGKATKVDVSGAEGGAKSCVEQAVKSTAFPKFQNESMSVKFPFKLGG